MDTTWPRRHSQIGQSLEAVEEIDGQGGEVVTFEAPV